MSQAELVAYTREMTGKSFNRTLKQNKKIPAVMYGASGNILLQLEEEHTRRVMERLTGKHQMVPLRIINPQTNEEKTHSVLIQAIQKHFYKHKLVHVDFRELNSSQTVVLPIPLKLVGEAPALKKGALLQMIVRTINVECNAANIPDFLEVDVSAIDVGNVLRVQEIKLPENVVLSAKQNYTVLYAGKTRSK
ncbi:MAG: 50S ribosomal protein L25 [SAR324 cluster bacterium]|nr:50S ribosomal protein L25 [SAR324 cluster bacterium]